MKRPEMPRAGLVAGWLARLAVAVGGATLAVRAGLPTATPVDPRSVNAFADPAEGGLDDAETGRGRHETPPTRRAVEEGHETKDLSGGTLARLVLGLGVSVAVVIGIVIGLRTLVTKTDERASPRLTAEQVTPIAPPAPTLQANPVEELAALHQREDAQMVGYAWRDKDHSEARIPLERAMELIVGHPLDTAP